MRKYTVALGWGLLWIILFAAVYWPVAFLLVLASHRWFGLNTESWAILIVILPAATVADMVADFVIGSPSKRAGFSGRTRRNLDTEEKDARGDNDGE